MHQRESAATLVRTWIPERSFLSELGLVAFIAGDAIKLAAAAIVLPRGWRRRRAR
jgi:hypothetical protein